MRAKKLHKHTTYLSKKLNYKNVLDGVNLDDLKDYRPGIEASKQAGVISPLAKFRFSKQDIRDISKALGFLGGINLHNLACHQDSLMEMK